jgi:hypothetical protein
MRFAPLTASYAITNFIAYSKELPIDLKTPWNISLKYWHMIENHDAVRASPHPTTFANICGMLLQYPPGGRGDDLRGMSVKQTLRFLILIKNIY